MEKYGELFFECFAWINCGFIINHILRSDGFLWALLVVLSLIFAAILLSGAFFLIKRRKNDN